MSEAATERNSESDSSLETITRGASLFFVGRVCLNALGFVFNVIMTRALGSALYGVFSYSHMLLGILISFSQLGTGKTLLRFVPAFSDDPTRQNWTTYLAYLTALVGSSLAGVALFVLAPTITALTLNDPLMTTVLRIMAIALPFHTLSNITYSLFRAIEKVEYQVLVSNLLKPVIRLLAVAAAILLGYSLIGIVAALAIGAILTFGSAVSILYLKTEIRPLGDRTSGSATSFYNFSIPLTLSDVGEKLYSRIDILIVGLFLTSEDVGVYRVAILLTGFLTLPLTGINQLFPSIASGLYSDGRMDELESVYRIVTRWVFTVVIPPALAIVVYRSEVLRIFGDDFTGGTVVLVLFAFAQLTNNAVGPSGFLLMMTDHQYLTLVNQWMLGILNVVLSYLLVLRLGFIGVAVATAWTLAFINVVRVFEVWYVERLTPYSWKYWKPMAAGFCTTAVMAGWKPFLGGYPLLVVGTATGSAAFLGALFVLGIEEEDRDFYRNNIKPVLD